jgi:ankyrin repeat protein
MGDMDRDKKVLAAIRARDFAAIRQLVGEDPGVVDARDTAGRSLVLFAAYAGAPDIAEWLGNRKTMDIFEAAVVGDVARASAIVAKSPAALDAFSPDGWTPLHLAAFFGQVAMARFLLAEGALPDDYSRNALGNQPLHAAVAGRQNVAVVRLLLDEGANPNARAAMGLSPLHIAAEIGHQELIDLLLQRGAGRYAAMDNGDLPADLARRRGHQAVADRLS